MTRVKAIVVGCVLTLALVSPLAAQRRVASLDAQQGRTENPFTSTEDVAAGQTSFQSRCASCHGFDATGNRGPDLTRGVFRHGSSDRALFLNILNGISGTGMPSVRLSDKEMWQIVAYVRSLSRGGGPVEGDAAAGRQVYDRSACVRCHWIDGQGGRLGPDLTAVGWRRSAVHLRASILDPDDDIDADYRQVTVRVRGGGGGQGILLNEDAFSIQLLDRAERLRSFAKSTLDEIERGAVSLMPSFEGRLSAEDVTNLVAYLASLKPE